VYATYKSKFAGYYHLLGAISNAWAGLYAIYYCDQFPNGEHLTLPVLIFIIFFGSYMVRLRWLAGCIAAITYVVGYQAYIIWFSDLTISQVLLYGFVAWMTLIFAILAGRISEMNNRTSFIQRKTIKEQSDIIEHEKEILLKEVHHRVKNNLQIIISLIKLQQSKLSDVNVEKEFREMKSRVMSMSIVHQRIHQSSNYNDISLSGYTDQLYAHVSSQYPEKKVTVEFKMPDDFHLDIESSIPCGLVLNELMSNFFKHCKGDHFSIIAQKANDGRCKLIYQDNGDGYPEGLNIDALDTLGMELIQILSEQLDGSMKFFTKNGARCEIEICI
jgi:two-component sensor histidine kinase